MKKVIVELRVSVDFTMDAIAETDAAQLPGFTVDPDYEPVPLSAPEEMAAALSDANEEVVLIRGEVDEETEEELRAQPNVIDVWTDAKVEIFEQADLEEMEAGFDPGRPAT